jgi:DnaJ-class molecular chaperone
MIATQSPELPIGNGNRHTASDCRVSAGSGASAAPACNRCGGSGKLRLGDQRYRTCLECLGQGQLLRPSPNTLFVPRISVAASASAAG